MPGEEIVLRSLTAASRYAWHLLSVQTRCYLVAFLVVNQATSGFARYYDALCCGELAGGVYGRGLCIEGFFRRDL